MQRKPMAIVHEWVSARAGSEQVFEALAAVFPQADLYALSVDSTVPFETGGRPIRTTFLDRPALRDRRGATLPAMPLAWRALGRGRYDVVVSSHHAFAASNRLAEGGAHLCYVHSPARYLWNLEIDGRAATRLVQPAARLLRSIDRRAAARVDAFAANSSAVAARIATHWKRESRVIFPPVRVKWFGDAVRDSGVEPYVLGVGRWIPYKNMHLVLAAGELAGLPVKIVGSGPEEGRLRSLAATMSVTTHFIESPDDEQLRGLYADASCLVFPTVEDFGIVPVEAQATGTPVVTVGAGGTLDTVANGLSGIYAASLEPADLAEAIKHARRLDRANVRRHAGQFSQERFATAVRLWVAEFVPG